VPVRLLWMSAACRHCFPDEPPPSAMGARKNQETTPWHPGDGSNALAGMTYRSRLAFVTIDALSERLDSIERGLGVFNGVTTWCERCRMCSVLSYSSYLHTLRVSNSRWVASPHTHPGPVRRL
jgi:hypothetical protein